MQKLCLPLVTRDSMDCYYRCLTILSMFPITFINLKSPRLCLWRRRSWGCGCSVNRACKYLTKNLCLQPLITGSVNIRDPNRQKNLKSTICNWSDHAILEKKFTIWKPLRRKNAASDTSNSSKGAQEKQLKQRSSREGAQAKELKQSRSLKEH